MADVITVAQLDKPSGVDSTWPQLYEISVTPESGRPVPKLPFLHKGDGISLEDGTGYWVDSARQVAVKTTHGTQWAWIYHVTRDASNDLKPWDTDEGPFGVSRFGR